MPTKPKEPKSSSIATAEADFNDTIAHNRGLKLLSPHTIPHPPAGYRPTDPEVRPKRLRRLAAELRSEALEALREAGGRDLRGELGRFAPEPERAAALVERLGHTAELVARGRALLEYAREMDQIAMSDALVFLESENKQYRNAVDHDGGLAPHYRALTKFMDARSGAITEGMARARSAEAARSSTVEPPVRGTEQET